MLLPIVLYLSGTWQFIGIGKGLLGLEFLLSGVVSLVLSPFIGALLPGRTAILELLNVLAVLYYCTWSTVGETL